ncbi:MAG: AEC family transporter [Polyangiales bacterium]
MLARAPLPPGAAGALLPSLLSLVAVLGVAWALARALGFSRAVTGAVLLTAGFSNTAFVGLPLTQALFPDPNYLRAALLVDTVTTTLGLWTLGVVLAHRFGGGTVPTAWAGVLLAPRPCRCSWGSASARRAHPLPHALLAALDLLGAATTPLAFLFLGMRLDLRGAWAARGPIAVVSVLKLGLMPLVAATVARALDLHGAAAAVGTLQSAMPTALVAAIIAERAGCDARVAAGAVAVTVPLGVALSALTAPWFQALAR